MNWKKLFGIEKKQEVVEERIYTSKEVCDMFGLTSARMCHFRYGQTVHSKNKTGGISKVYKMPACLIEGKDWYKDGREIIYRESAIQILKERRHYEKSGKLKNSKLVSFRATRTSPKDGFLTLREVARSFNVKYSDVYNLRDASPNIPKLADESHILKMDEDWIYHNSGILLKKESVEKVKAFLEKKRNPFRRARKVTILWGNISSNISGEKAKKILEILRDKSDSDVSKEA